jgi:hypothetical protein
MVAEAEAFRGQLEQETLASLRRDPSRWRHSQAAKPDEHRRRARRQPWSRDVTARRRRQLLGRLWRWLARLPLLDLGGIR